MRHFTHRLVALLILGFVLSASRPARAQTEPHPDVNRDGIVDQADVAIVQGALGQRVGQPGYIPNADLNGDGVINTVDLTFVRRNLGRTYPVQMPTIVATVAPAANANGWHRTNATISFACTNTTSCPDAIEVTTEGAGQVIERTVQSSSGATATTSVTLNLDRTPPLLAPAMPTVALAGTIVTVVVTAVDLSGLAVVRARRGADVLATATAVPFELALAIPASAQDGELFVFDIEGEDRAGNVATITRSLTIDRPDTVEPTASVTVPPIAAPGEVIPLIATAQDDRRLVSLSLEFVGEEEGVLLGSLDEGPFTLQRAYAIPADVQNGTTFTFLARARDAAGNLGTAVASVTVDADAVDTPLELIVDEPFSPTFQTSSVLTGRIGPGTPRPRRATPFLASLSQTLGRQGARLEVGVVGVDTDFTPGLTDVTFGPGVIVEQVLVDSPTSLVASVHVAETASIGPRLVVVTTPTSEAFLTNAFRVVSGIGGVTGRLVTVARAPIAGGSVCLPSGSDCVASGADGTFTMLALETTAGRLDASAAGFTPRSFPVQVRLGETSDAGEVELAVSNEPPPPPEPNTPPIRAALATALARMFLAATAPETLSAEQARRLVIDTVLLVGADELGVLDGSGAQLNPEVSGAGPLSLTDRAVDLQARALRQGATSSLEEVAFTMLLAYEWAPPGPPDIDAIVAALQRRVNEAWADPDAPASALAILLFNNGPALSSLPPVLSRATRINSLHGFLLHAGVLLEGYWAHVGGDGTPEDPPDDAHARRGAPGPSWRDRMTAPLRVAGALLGRERSVRGRLDLGARVPRDGDVVGRALRLDRRTAQQGEPEGPRPNLRQLSRSLRDAKDNFITGLVSNFFSAVMVSAPVWAAFGGVSGLTLASTMIGALTDVFVFSALGARLAASMAPPPPYIRSVQQVGNKIRIEMQRVPLDLRCRQELLIDPESQAGLCNFQYSVFRRTSGGAERVITSRYTPRFADDVTPGTFVVWDNNPQPGLNWYYADVIHRLPINVPPHLQAITGALGIATRLPITVPVGNIIGMFFLSELISDYSGPNPVPMLNYAPQTRSDYDRVRVAFTPAPPVNEYPFLKSDVTRNLFASNTGLRQLNRTTSTGAEGVIRPSFGYHVGLAVDGYGHAFTVSGDSQARLGGRIFRFTPAGEQRFVGTINRYSPILDIGRVVDVAAIAMGPGLQGRANAFVGGDVFAADNIDHAVKRVPTSIIPAGGIEVMPAPGHGIFGPLAASPVVGFPYVRFPACSNLVRIRDIVMDRQHTLYALVGTDIYKVRYDAARDAAGPVELLARTAEAGPATQSSVRLITRDNARAIAHRTRLKVRAESNTCLGDFTWEVGDSSVLEIVKVSDAPGASEIFVKGLKPGVSTLRVTYASAGATIPATEEMTVTVLETGPILFVHGWRGTGTGWQEPMNDLAQAHGLPSGGILCASWVRQRGFFIRVRDFKDHLRLGNDDTFICDEAREDGSFFSLTFDDNQQRFVDTAAELSDIVNQIVRATGWTWTSGDEERLCADEFNADHCPRLTLVAHSMGGQTARSFIQGLPHSPMSRPGFTPSGVATPQVPTPFRPFKGEVRKLVSIGTMYLGTPVPNLTADQMLLFTGVTDALGPVFDPFETATHSMRVGSEELTFLNDPNRPGAIPWEVDGHTIPGGLASLEALELVSIVTQMSPTMSSGACTALATGSLVGAFALSNPWVLAIATAATVVSGQGTVVSLPAIALQSYLRLCTEAGAQDLPVPLNGTLGRPAFLPNSDEIVGVDSQNVNNLFRYVNGIEPVHTCVDEDRVPGHAYLRGTVRCHVGILHHEDTAQSAILLAELDLVSPSADPAASTASTVSSVPTPALASMGDPRKLAVDEAGNLYVTDRARGAVSVIRPNSLSGLHEANVFVTGVGGVDAIEVEGGFLFLSRGVDVIRVPLGVSGRVVDTAGEPVIGAAITARGFGGAQTRPHTTDASGAFSIPLESIESVVSGERLDLLLSITTRGTAAQPSRTIEVTVPLSVSDDGERGQTAVEITLPAL